MPEPKGVAICIPASGKPVPLMWAVNLQSLMMMPVNTNCTTFVVLGKHVDEARTELVEKALAANVKYIFFLDEDTVPPPNAVRHLLKVMETHDYIDVVGGIYVSKSDEPYPLVFRSSGNGSYWNWKPNELFWVTWLGMGSTMIRAEIFHHIPKPWWKTVRESEGDKLTRSTEDAFVCEKILRANGYEKGLDDHMADWEAAWPIWADASLLCEHHDIQTGKVYTLDKDGPCLKN
jgi:glycosyl transferase family 2